MESCRRCSFSTVVEIPVVAQRQVWDCKLRENRRLSTVQFSVIFQGELITQVMSSCKLVSVTDVASPMFCDHTHPSSSLRNNNKNNKAVYPKRAHFSLCVTCDCEMDLSWLPVTRAAQRRRGPGRVDAPLLKRTGWPGPGSGYEKKYTAEFWENPLPRLQVCSTSFSTTTSHLPPVRGLTVSLTSGRRSESRGASWSRSSTQYPSRFSTPLCRRWWTQWWKCWRSSTSRCLTSSRSSKCPRSVSTRFRRAPLSLAPQMAAQLVEVPLIEFIVFRRHAGELGIAVCRDARDTRMMRVHDTGWRDTASPGRYTNTGHR